MARRIVITSGKGGVGKTSVAVFLGEKLSESGERVALLDLDFGLNNLDVAVGVEDRVIYDIVDVVEGRCRVKQALIPCSSKNLYIIPSAHTFSKGVSGQSVKLLIEGLSGSFDYILIDCPAGIDSGFERAVLAADEAIVVVTPTLASLRDADKVLTILRSYKMESISVVMNRTRRDLTKKKLELCEKEVASVLRVPVIANIPESDDILLAKNCFLPHGSKSSAAFKKLANQVKANKQNARDYSQIYGGLFKSAGDNKK